MKKTNLAGSLLVLLAISLSVAQPAEAQRRAPEPVRQGDFRQPAQNFQGVRGGEQSFPRTFPQNFPENFQRQGDARGVLNGRGILPEWAFPGRVAPRERFTPERDFTQRDYRRAPDQVSLPPRNGAERWVNGGDRRLGALPWTGRQGFVNDGRQGFGAPLRYRGDERRFAGPGYIDPYNHIRGGNGFFDLRDNRFAENQFEGRWGRGFYGQTHGYWSRYRVGGHWPWYPRGLALGIAFYNGWGYNGIEIAYGDSGYYALDGFCPTEYLYLVGTGNFWRPIAGQAGWYGSSLPDDYAAPITVAVREIVPVTDEDGYVEGYESHTFYYNAFFDESSGRYGYYDYSGAFHWVR